MRGGKKIEERMVKMDIIPKMKMGKAISTHVKMPILIVICPQTPISIIKYQKNIFKT